MVMNKASSINSSHIQGNTINNNNSIHHGAHNLISNGKSIDNHMYYVEDERLEQYKASLFHKCNKRKFTFFLS